MCHDTVESVRLHQGCWPACQGYVLLRQGLGTTGENMFKGKSAVVRNRRRMAQAVVEALESR